VGLRNELPGDLVHSLHGGQAGADVQELRDAGVHAEPRGPAEETAVLPDQPRQLRDGTGRALDGPPIGREVVLATEPVVVPID
jgi:hypothetical protein